MLSKKLKRHPRHTAHVFFRTYLSFTKAYACSENAMCRVLSILFAFFVNTIKLNYCSLLFLLLLLLLLLLLFLVYYKRYIYIYIYRVDTSTFRSLRLHI